MNYNKEIATTILQQLGGRRFVMFTGAKDFTAIDNGLQLAATQARQTALRLPSTVATSMT